MLLFLDVISPLPEFYVIEDNKIIFQRKIVTNNSQKLSNNIFETYIKIKNDLDLTNNLKKLAMTVGPGSFTSLRIGASFISGLQISRNLEFCPISINTIFKIKSEKLIENDIGFYINSSQDQNFFCFINNQNKIEYSKLEYGNLPQKKNISTIFYNLKKYNSKFKNVKQHKFSFIDEFISNYEKMNFQRNLTIKPIYISNNRILN